MAGFERGGYRVALATGTAAGGVVSLANPEGVDVYVTDVFLDVGTGSTGASTIDVGIAVGATTSSDNLIDGRSGATAGVYTNHSDPGSNGKSGQLWADDAFLTASQASGAVAGIAGELIIQYVIR